MDTIKKEIQTEEMITSEVQMRMRDRGTVQSEVIMVTKVEANKMPEVEVVEMSEGMMEEEVKMILGMEQVVT